MSNSQKTNHRIGVYAGTFDPLTNGHLWMIEQGVQLFDELIVAIGENPDKRTLFAVDERLEMIKESTAHLAGLRIDSFSNEFLINYALSVGARYILRGIRNENDFRFERTICTINRDIDDQVTMVFLTPPNEVTEVSSSMVKGLVGPNRWEELVRRYVPPPVFAKLKEMRNAR